MVKIKFLKLPLILSLFLLLPFAGCEVAQQAQQVANLVNCDFRIKDVADIRLAGVQFQNIKSISDFSVVDAARLMASLAAPTVPLSLRLDLEGRNPNVSAAGLNRLEWILFIDDIQMTTGILDKSFTIPPQGVTTIPMALSVDLKKVLSGKSANALFNFCLNLAGAGNKPTRFKIKLKPTVYVAGRALTYPGYINVKTEYGAK